jgi:hypothetical protein
MIPSLAWHRFWNSQFENQHACAMTVSHDVRDGAVNKMVRWIDAAWRGGHVCVFCPYVSQNQGKERKQIQHSTAPPHRSAPKVKNKKR